MSCIDRTTKRIYINPFVYAGTRSFLILYHRLLYNLCFLSDYCLRTFFFYLLPYIVYIYYYSEVRLIDTFWN